VAKFETECSCNNGWVCEEHPDQPWEHDGCGAAGELCKNPECDKDADSIFLTVHVECSPEDENRQLGRLHYLSCLVIRRAMYGTKFNRRMPIL
jgi:hypothetical protein